MNQKILDQLTQQKVDRVDRLTVLESPVLAPQEVALDRFTLLTGMHGVGKSYLLRVLNEILPNWNMPPTGPPFLRGVVEHEGTVRGVYRTSFVDPSGPGSEWLSDFSQVAPETDLIPSRYLDPASAFSEYGMLFQELPLRPYHERHIRPGGELKPTELPVLRAILGRRYEFFRWRELVDLEMPVPVFEAGVDGRTISNATMSSGELWVHWILWAFRVTPAPAVMLVDEPEAFLSPPGQAALYHELARLTLANGLQTIIATHSTTMIREAPPASIRLLVPGTDGARVLTPDSPTDALRLLGHEVGISAVILVEDVVAATVVRAVLGTFAPELAVRAEVIVAEGESKARKLGRAFQASERLRACVVLDGDQRHAERKGDAGMPLVFLPGQAPEPELLAPVLADPELLANRSGRTGTAVRIALEACRLEDHHRWFSVLARTLLIDEPVLVDHVVSIWCRSEAAGVLVGEIRTALRF
ncbi:AAA family ATPase [Kribbella sp. NPDC051770]|uniref:AAA family ATPase n=1 Tax=Kribbella sp. NPDC051770 TaxID=3155413 RepID=UPI00341F57AE